MPILADVYAQYEASNNAQNLELNIAICILGIIIVTFISDMIYCHKRANNLKIPLIILLTVGIIGIIGAFIATPLAFSNLIQTQQLSRPLLQQSVTKKDD